MGKILIKNGKVWNGYQFSYVDILTDEKRIVKIENDIQEYAEFVYDARGKIVAPGLVDVHTHMKGISDDSLGTDVNMSCIPFGVTCAADATGDKGNEKLMGSFLVKSKTFVAVGTDFREVDFEKTTEDIVRYRSRIAGIKTYADAGIYTENCMEKLERVVRFAEEKHLPIMVHVTNTPVSMEEILQILRKGDIITHAYHGGENNIAVNDYKAFQVAKKKGVLLDVGYAGNVNVDFRVLGEAIKAGKLPDIISTDITRLSAYKRGGRYGMTMCMSIARHLGMTEEDIFKSVTSVPAKALGLDAGVLELGKTGDIAVFSHAEEGFDLTDKSGNRVAADIGYRCEMTMVDGEIVYIR